MREEAAAELTRVGEEMIKGFAEAQAVLDDPNNLDEERQEEAMAKFMWDIVSSEVRRIDEYANNNSTFGIEYPERMFWEAFVVRQNIYRDPDSPFHRGRGSEPAFRI